ncbi:MAG: hypothetical protein V1747_07090 [Candidatus Omnitrophota bacterium]
MNCFPFSGSDPFRKYGSDPFRKYDLDQVFEADDSDDSCKYCPFVSLCG